MRNKIFAAFSATTMLLCSACGNTNSEIQGQSSRYLLVEYWTNITGTTSEERCDGYSYWDGPNYRYEANVLQSSFHKDFTESTSILGCGIQFNDPVGTGVFSNLYEIEGFPYTPDWADFCQTLTIENIDASGTISAKVNDKTVTVPIGQEWTDSLTDLSDPSCEKVTTYRLTNFGFIDASQIVMPEK